MESILELTIPLCPITKKNNQRICYNSNTGKPFIKPSYQYEQYERNCGLWLGKYRRKQGFPIMYPVEVECVFYMEKRNRVDLTNLLEAIDDILVHYGVLEDDSYKIIVSHDGSRVRFDKDNPRTEIVIRKPEKKEVHHETI